MKCPKCHGKGTITPNKLTAETLASARNAVTAAEMAIALGIKVEAAYNRLERMADNGLLKRSRKKGAKRGWIYKPS